MSIFETRLILLGYDVSVATRPKRFSIFWMTTSKSITKATGHLSDCSCTRPGSKSRDTSTVMKSNKVHSVDSPCFGFFCCCFFFCMTWLAPRRFLNSLSSFDDVYFTTIKELIQWTKNPRTTDTPLFPCDEPPQPAQCARVVCGYKPDKTPFAMERYMNICNRPCPPYYPWYGNIDGSRPPTPWTPWIRALGWA